MKLLFLHLILQVSFHLRPNPNSYWCLSLNCMTLRVELSNLFPFFFSPLFFSLEMVVVPVQVEGVEVEGKETGTWALQADFKNSISLS